MSYNSDRSNLYRNFSTATNYFKSSFFSYYISEWNKLSTVLRNSASASIIKNDLLKFIRPKNATIYKIFDHIGLKLLTRLRVNLSHLRQHKFRHNFLDTLNPLCSCSLEVESTSHYLLRCSFYADKGKVLFGSISNAIGDL